MSSSRFCVGILARKRVNPKVTPNELSLVFLAAKCYVEWRKELPHIEVGGNKCFNSK